MKTRNLLAGIFTILVISGYAMGQEFWLPNSTHIYNTNSGNVGIGTTNPSEKLHIAGSVRGNQYGAIRISTGYGYVDIGPKNTSWSHFVTDRGRFYFNKGISIDTGYLGSYNENLYLQTSGTTRMTILNSNGNVGIGTMSPQSKLAVNGTITAKEVEVTLTGWPDHVFADGYRIMPLAEVETFIKANRHLPDMPPAAEVEENGVSLGDMQARLLQKVEELTLYVIDLKKENEALKARLESLER